MTSTRYGRDAESEEGRDGGRFVGDKRHNCSPSLISSDEKDETVLVPETPVVSMARS
jgi:hypothetical protein